MYLVYLIRLRVGLLQQEGSYGESMALSFTNA